MPNGPVRNRSQRVAMRVPTSGSQQKIMQWAQTLFVHDRGLTKLSLLCAATFLLCVIIEAWNPPFTFQLHQRPLRDVVCRVPFSVESPQLTNDARKNARFDTPHIYVNDPSKITQLKTQLVTSIRTLLAIENYNKMSEDDKALWGLFLSNDTTTEAAAEAFTKLQDSLARDNELESLKLSIDKVFQPYEKNGILLKLHGIKDGNQEVIQVYDLGSSLDTLRDVSAEEVLIGNAYALKDTLNWEFNREVAEFLFQWIRSEMKSTLTENSEATLKAQREAEKNVGPVMVQYEAGQILAVGEKELNRESVTLLHCEYRASLAERTWTQKILRFVGVYIFLIVSMMLASFFVRFRQEEISQQTVPLRIYFSVYGLILASTAIGRLLQIGVDHQFGNPELIPILVFAQGMTIAYSWEVGIITTFIVTLSLNLSGAFNLATFLVIIGTVTTITILSSDIRNRGQVLLAACGAGVTTFILSFATGLVQAQEDLLRLLITSFYRMGWVILSGFFMAGLLPFIERIFGILTPMRLMEFGNPSHPLLQELARRAPATYNHSMQTAAIAEAAAEAIGARAALVRVGAYFHDIGKILKPDYFTENQSGFNIHDTLEPRVSTLIIVAHVKDGVNLAQQNNLPQPIIDLIEQHHGTMLVSFFYARANQVHREATGQDLDESLFRYPGPIPQTKEAGILMLSDAVESACRSLGDATPGKVENLVRQLTEARMEDGQFDACGLTLGEIRTIEKSLLVSILAMRHSRIKYPEKPNPRSNDSSVIKESGVKEGANAINAEKKPLLPPPPQYSQILVKDEKK